MSSTASANPVARAARWLGARWLPLIGGVVLAVTVIDTVVHLGADPRQWEWFYTSGILLLFVCLVANHGQNQRVLDTLDRLVRQGVVGPGDAESVEREVTRAMRHRVPVAAAVTSVAFVLVMTVLWLLAAGETFDHWATFWLEIFLAGLAGIVVGRMIAYGGLGSAIKRAGLQVTPIPGHIDGAAGLRPIGALYLRQATIVAALALYAGFWWLVLPQYSGGRFMNWHDPYLLLMLVGIVAEILVCVVPLWGFHRIMLRQKILNRRIADQQAARIAELKSERARTHGKDDQQRIDAEIDALATQWEDLETMPTWPLDSRVRRRLTINNALVFLPIALNAIAPGGWWQQFLDAFRSIA